MKIIQLSQYLNAFFDKMGSHNILLVGDGGHGEVELHFMCILKPSASPYYEEGLA